MSKDRGVISLEFAKRIAAVVRYVERMMGKGVVATSPRRESFYIPIVWVKLTADLNRNSFAAGTLLKQADDPDNDGAGGAWTLRTDDAATVKVFAKHLTGTINLIPDGFKLASGCVVACSRNPQSGLLNLLQSTCCPVAV